MRFLLAIIILIGFFGCKATAEQKAERKSKRIAKRAYADSVYFAQKHNYMIEQQGQNFPETQDQDNNDQ